MVEFIFKSTCVLMMPCFFSEDLFLSFFLLDLLKKASHICLCLHNHHNKYFSKLVNAVLLVNPLTVLKLVKLVNSSLFCGYMRYPEIICCPNCC